ncbi:MAG: enoyl-CoA hydratase/carnithine racemase, partial [Dinoroseobacter sp.]
ELGTGFFPKCGIAPEACSSWFLPRIAGINQALEWAFWCESLMHQKHSKKDFSAVVTKKPIC